MPDCKLEVTGSPVIRSTDLVSRPTPYYDQDGITIYCGDNRTILPMLDDYDLLLTDPPYGINADADQSNTRRHPKDPTRIANGKAKCASRKYQATEWDNSPPPAWVLQLAMAKAKWQVLWGGNYYGLPASKCWLVWDKENGNNGYADCELAWTNLDMAVRRIKYRWMGMLQENMAEKEIRYHPTQKPVPVMEWCIGWTDAQTICDPWMGSGTTLIAARAKGRKAVGIEINEQYCDAAIARLAQGVLLAC